MKKTPLYEQHVNARGQMVDFAGWMMPLNYGSQLNEHKFVREHAGLFDVSHMAIFDIKGQQAKAFLSYLLANDITKISHFKALYSCMLNEEGGVKDDLIVYQLSDDFYRIISNASTREKNQQWLTNIAQAFSVEIILRDDLGIIALQGPEAINIAKQFFDLPKLTELKPFEFTLFEDIVIARTGYTGEDGFEIIIPIAKLPEIWQALVMLGAKPCGLGARDTLRLEAGLNLYGSDMDETTTPMESNLEWTIGWEHDFVGKNKLIEAKQNASQKKLIGLIMQERGVLRNHQKIELNNGTLGEITSGTFSPTLGHSIALARISGPIDEEGTVTIRDKVQKITVVKPPFVRKGKPIYKKY